MNEIQKKIFEKIKTEMRKLEEIDTPACEDLDCGSCTADRQYNRNYSSSCYRTENYMLIENSCGNFLKSGDEIEIGTMTRKELLELLQEIKKEVVAQLENDTKILQEIFVECQ